MTEEEKQAYMNQEYSFEGKINKKIGQAAGALDSLFKKGEKMQQAAMKKSKDAMDKLNQEAQSIIKELEDGAETMADQVRAKLTEDLL